MPVEKWSDSVVVVRLADNPHLAEDLETLDQMTQSPRRLDAVIDFSGVKFLNSSNLAKLLKLRRQMGATRRELVRCWDERPGLAGLVLKARDEIERVFGVLTCTAGGLAPLPAWVRTLPRVRRWVGAKIILYNARLKAQERKQLMAVA